MNYKNFNLPNKASKISDSKLHRALYGPLKARNAESNSTTKHSVTINKIDLSETPKTITNGFESLKSKQNNKSSQSIGMASIGHNGRNSHKSIDIRK